MPSSVCGRLAPDQRYRRSLAADDAQEREDVFEVHPVRVGTAFRPGEPGSTTIERSGRTPRGNRVDEKRAIVARR